MPRVSEFYGIKVEIYYDEHPPPHFHAKHGGHEALIEINSLTVWRGSLPQTALKLLQKWAQLNHANLIAAWNDAQHFLPIRKIKPLI